MTELPTYALKRETQERIEAALRAPGILRTIAAIARAANVRDKDVEKFIASTAHRGDQWDRTIAKINDRHHRPGWQLWGVK